MQTFLYRELHESAVLILPTRRRQTEGPFWLAPCYWQGSVPRSIAHGDTSGLGAMEVHKQYKEEVYSLQGGTGLS